MDDEIYDLRGLQCPLPVLKTRHKLRPMPVGERLTVLSDDPLAAIDIPHFCTEHAQCLIEQLEEQDAMRFVIERREGKL